MGRYAHLPPPLTHRVKLTFLEVDNFQLICTTVLALYTNFYSPNCILAHCATIGNKLMFLTLFI